MNNNEPIVDCPYCDHDGFNIINGDYIVCIRCNGTGLIVID